MTTHAADYELFRQAVQEGDADAWATLAGRYRRLLIKWAGQCYASHMSGESLEDLADRAFARAWLALTPEHFATFPSLSALLAYLRRCVTATAIDAMRSRLAQDRIAHQAERAVQLPIEHLVLAHLDRAELWQTVAPLLKTDVERVIIVERFVYALPPRTILARHPALFDEVIDVYAAIRRLCERLRRNPELRRLYDDRCAA